MALIRRYGQFPAMFVPDVGEVVRAASSPAGPFRRCVVLNVNRAADDFIRIGLKPIEPGNPDAPAFSVHVRRDDDIPLVRRVPVT